MSSYLSHTRHFLCFLLICVLFGVATSLSCFVCGQYTDGVGSITPCLNLSLERIQNCPTNAKYCIKYVSELAPVKDCVASCHEREKWGTYTYCCNTDNCNGTSLPSGNTALVLIILIGIISFVRR